MAEADRRQDKQASSHTDREQVDRADLEETYRRWAERYGHWEPDSYSSRALFELTDRAYHAGIARFTFGLSPQALTAAYLDWAGGLAFAPGKQLQLYDKAFRKFLRFAGYSGRVAMGGGCPECITPLEQDHRFTNDEWKKPPFNLMSQAFLLTQQWWHNATTGIPGVTPANERAAEFAARQILDMIAPSNFVATNPEVLNATIQSGGMNLVQGYQNFLEDWQRQVSGSPPVGAEKYRVGETVAVTPGEVVYENDLIELIQYTPATPKVDANPVLIVPAWIMKYYILDLSPENSLVRYLVEKGHTVFMISWKNPGSEDRDLGMDDYARMGPLSALDTISDIMPDRKVQAVGYCLGGTLLAIVAAAMARDKDDRLASLTFLATQVDFEEAGELLLFISTKQLAFLNDMMWEQGFLDTRQMAGAFQMLRSNDLIWSRLIHEYLMGERRPMNDLMAWNADLTRMPYRMHSEYLSELFLHNDLVENRYHVDGKPITLSDIRVPVFLVATERDHVAPWRSVHKFILHANTECTFLLTSGGHNAGIVSEPNHPRRHYRVVTCQGDDRYEEPETLMDRLPTVTGSWWPEWEKWLSENGGGKVAPPDMKGHASIRPAPGKYVLEQ